MLKAEEVHIDRWEVYSVVDVMGKPHRKQIANFTRVHDRWMMHVNAGIWYSQATVRELNDIFTKLVAGQLKNGAKV